jgi:hypothetical protein
MAQSQSKTGCFVFIYGWYKQVSTHFKMTRYLILLTIFFLSCGQTQPENRIDESSELNEKIVSDTIGISYDRHQYFNDVKTFPTDSLRKIISLSDKVFAFNWNDEDRNPANVSHYLVDGYGVFDKRIGKKVELTKKEITKLSSLLADTANFSNELGDCFIPHIAFTYFLKDSVIGQTNICFICAGQKSIPKTKNEAFSDIGYKKFNEFCSLLGLKIVQRTDK